MTERELRQHRCCFTGHRPEKLEQPETVVVEALKKEGITFVLGVYSFSHIHISLIFQLIKACLSQFSCLLSSFGMDASLRRRGFAMFYF